MPSSSIMQALAVLFLGALVGGRLATLFRVPRVTGYLLVGLLAGPSLAEILEIPPLLPAPALSALSLLSELALALILMNIGGLFQVENLRRWKHRIALFSLAEIGVTFGSVAVLTFAINSLFLHRLVPGFSLQASSAYFALFLGIIAVATAPAATLMVIREYEAEGPVTAAVLTLVGINNLLSILGFTIAAHFLILPAEGLSTLLVRIAFPPLLGTLSGLALSFWAQRLELSSEYKILLLGGVAAVTGISHGTATDPMLANLFLGISLANSSPRWHRLIESLRQVDYPLYVAFFILAGANLHLQTLRHIGVIGMVYVVARTAGKLGGARLGARLGHFGERQRAVTGMTLLAQAGVAIGLTSTLARQWPAGGHLVETVILGSVIFFELVGPLAVRHGLVAAGEVPILSLLRKRAPQGTLEGLHDVVQHFRTSLGIPAGHQLRDPGDILVKHVMRRNVETILNSTPFNELLRLIAHSRYDRFPVVDAAGHFIGMIDYTEIRTLLFEPSLVHLVVAGDLLSTQPTALYPEMPLREALKVLQLHRSLSFFPVVDQEDPAHLLGILSQNDVLAAFRRLDRF